MENDKSTVKVIIHDVSNGNWEINELVYPLVREYRPGLTTILPLQQLSTHHDAEYYGAYLTSPKWYDYVLFGIRLIKVQTQNIISFIKNSLNGKIPFKQFYGKKKITRKRVRRTRKQMEAENSKKEEGNTGSKK